MVWRFLMNMRKKSGHMCMRPCAEHDGGPRVRVSMSTARRSSERCPLPWRHRQWWALRWTAAQRRCNFLRKLCAGTAVNKHQPGGVRNNSQLMFEVPARRGSHARRRAGSCGRRWCTPCMNGLSSSASQRAPSVTLLAGRAASSTAGAWRHQSSSFGARSARHGTLACPRRYA
jgi:hypothetical protein